MLEKPDIPDELVAAALEEQYGLDITELTFLPLGADLGTVVYRVLTESGKAYFLKLRQGFDEITVKVPLFLKSQGINEIIPPFETKSDRAWGEFRAYKTILYPFVQGQDSFSRQLTDNHRRRLGAAMRTIHAVKLSPELEQLIPVEVIPGTGRE